MTYSLCVVDSKTGAGFVLHAADKLDALEQHLSGVEPGTLLQHAEAARLERYLTVRLGEKAFEHLQRMNETGLWGLALTDTAERLIDEGLLRHKTDVEFMEE